MNQLPIHTETDGPFAGVVTVTLEQPGKPVVVLELELMQRLEATLRGVSPHARGVVLASASERVFVAGADLKAISELPDGQLDDYLQYGSRVFAMLSNLPCPTVAAINGAALGGGLELAMHCDGLVAAPPAPRDGQPGKPYMVGLPEAGLSICPGWGGTNLLGARIDPVEALRRTANGTTLMFDEAVAFGMFDAVATDAADLLPAAKCWVVSQTSPGRGRDGSPKRWIGRPDCVAAAVRAVDVLRAELGSGGGPAMAVLEAADAGLTKGWQAALAVERRRLIQLRSSTEGKAAIQAFFAKSRK